MLLIILKIIIMLPYLIFMRNVDMMRDKKNGKVHLYGIYGFFGLPGKGKTMCMSKYLADMRKKYGDKIYIMTNYCYNDEDFPFTGWRDLLKTYDKPLIVAWDEVQNEFNSRDFKNFPIQLLTLLTQVRKSNGIQLLYTAQRWHFVDKNFRSLSFGCYECSTVFERYTFAKLYDPVDYDNLCSQSDYDKRRKIHPKGYMDFLQTNALRTCYDSYKMLQTAMSKEYMDRAEVAQIEQKNNSTWEKII